MGYDFDKVIPRRGTNCSKFDAAAERGLPADILPLWVADMDFQAPECVLEALGKAVEHGIFGYSILGGGYFPAVANWFRGHFGWEVREDWLVTTPGVVFALAAAVRVATKPGDKVLVQPPVYYPFYDVVRENGRSIVESPLVYQNGRYTIDFEDFEAKLRDNDVKLFILCSPHNPVGRVWTREEQRRIGALCRRYGVKVISDEIHCDFAFPEHPHTPFAVACPEMAEDTIVCTAPSKSFNLAGLQVSNIFIPGEALRQAYREEMTRIHYGGPNRLGAIACQAAYAGAGEWLEACKAYMRENLRYVREFLAARLPKIRLVEPEGTYFAWLDCTALGLSGEELDALVIRDAGLWLDTGGMFGACAEKFQRVVLACPRATVKEALERLEAAVNGRGL